MARSVDRKENLMKYERIGSSTMNKVTKYNPCPICGKPDWCFSSTSTYSFEDGTDEDFEFIGCRRISGDQIAGIDGNYYQFEHESSDGVMFFEELMQRARRHQRMGIDANVKTSREYVIKSSKRKRCINEYKLESVERRDQVYRALIDLLQLENYHRLVFYDEFWDHDLIESSMYRSLPPTGYQISQLIKKKKSGKELDDYEQVSLKRKNQTRRKIAEKIYLMFGDLEGIPGFYLKHDRYKDEYYWTFAGAQGILMPMYNVQGKIFGMRIRLDVVKKSGKYKWFTSVYEKMIKETEDEEIFENTYKKGSKLPLGISYKFPKQQTPFLFATEGEKKQHVVVEVEGLACANIPGVSSFSRILDDTEYLKEKGIKYIVIGYDADKSQNTHVLKAELKLIKALLEKGFEIFVAGWDEKHGKGVDDVILSGNKISYDALLDYLKQFDK